PTVSASSGSAACSRMRLASTTTRTLSNSSIGSAMPTWAMRAGSDTPLASMTIHSGAGSRAMTRASASSSPPRMLQHTQPLARLMVSPSQLATSAASMFTGPKSLTSTAARRWLRARMRFSSELLPAPRKPPTTVSAIRGGAAISGSRGRQRPAAHHGPDDARVLQVLGAQGARVVAQHAEVGPLADLDRADLVVQVQGVGRAQRDGMQRGVHADPFGFSQHAAAG